MTMKTLLHHSWFWNPFAKYKDRASVVRLQMCVSAKYTANQTHWALVRFCNSSSDLLSTPTTKWTFISKFIVFKCKSASWPKQTNMGLTVMQMHVFTLNDGAEWQALSNEVTSVLGKSCSGTAVRKQDVRRFGFRTAQEQMSETLHPDKAMTVMSVLQQSAQSVAWTKTKAEENTLSFCCYASTTTCTNW